MEDSKKDYKSIVSSEAFPGILLLLVIFVIILNGVVIKLLLLKVI